MSATRYLRALPYPTHLTPLHFHVLRTLGLQGPLSSVELFDTLSEEQKTLSWKQPSIEKNPTRPMASEELEQLTAQFGELAIASPQVLEANVTRSFFKKKIITPLKLSGAIQPQRISIPSSSSTLSSQTSSSTDTEMTSKQKKRQQKRMQERMRFGFYVDWRKFPGLARTLESERREMFKKGTLPASELDAIERWKKGAAANKAEQAVLDRAARLPLAKPLTAAKQQAAVRAKEELKRKHQFILPPQGGKRPARRRQEIWQHMRDFNRRGKKYFETTGLWGEGRPIPKGY